MTTQVDAGGLQTVASGAIVSGAVLSGGTQQLASGAVVSGTTLYDGGSQYVSGGAESTQAVLSGGTASVDDGGVIQIDAASAGVLNLLYTGGATAIFGSGSTTSTGSYSITTLNASGDKVILGQGNSTAYSAVGNTLSIGTLNGWASFVVNTDLANDKSDSITIGTTDANSTKNTIQVNYDPSADLGADVYSKTAGGVAVVTVTNNANDAQFTAAEGEIGAYTYIPILVSTTTGSTTTWSITGLTLSGASETLYSGVGNAAYNLALWRDGDSTVNHRLMELRHQSVQQGIWAEISRSGQRIANLGHEVDGTATRITVGYDKQAGSTDWQVGGAMTRQEGSEGYAYGHGSSNAASLTTYALWKEKAAAGRFAELTVRAGRISTDFTTLLPKHGTTVSGDHGYWGEGVGAAYGFHRDYDHGWFLEPKAGLSWSHLNRNSYTTSDGTTAHQEEMDSLLARLSIGAGLRTQHGGMAYLEAALVHDFMGEASVTMQSNGLRSMCLQDDLHDTWLDLTLGWRQQLKDTSWYAEAGTRAIGGEVHRSWVWKAGANWAF